MSENLPTIISAEEQEIIDLAKRNKRFERDELVIPFLKILQPLSPIVQEGEANVPGAKPGMLYNTSSEQLHDGKTGIVCCVVGHQKSVTEWIPRAAGGGFVRDWGVDDAWKASCEPNQRDAYQPVTKSGNNILKSRLFYLFQIDTETGEYDPSVISMPNTFAKVASRWATMLNNERTRLSNGTLAFVPHYFYTYRLTTELKKNNKGVWYVPRVTKNADETGNGIKLKDLKNGPHLWEAAKQFQESLNEGAVRVDDQDNEGFYGNGDNEDKEDNIPF